MDENNINLNEENEQPEKNNPFKSRAFYVSYFITIVIITGISLLFTGGAYDYWALGVLLLCIPCAFAGLISWAIVRRKNKSIALGILLGGLTPFIAVFVMSGGCGLVGRF